MSAVEKPKTDTVLSAGCKVNLFLVVKERRPDGLHNLESFFLPLPSPADRLEVSPASPGSGLQLTCSDASLNGESNLVAAAWKLFGELTGFWPDLEVRLQKGIPVGAGLAGGSSDAAAMLGLLGDLAPPEVRPSSRELVRMAGRLGADVPFFLMNTPAWVEGTGEHIRPVRADLPDCRLLIVCPRQSVSTRQAYQDLDQARSGSRVFPPSRALTSEGNIFTGGLRFSGRCFYNSFEEVIFDTYPAIGGIKRDLLKLGASGVVLSGSGSAMVAAYTSTAAIEAGKDALHERDIPWYEVDVSGWGVAKR